MSKRPLAVTVISIVLIITGTGGLVYHAGGSTANVFQYDFVGIALVSLAAVAGGAYMLRARGWARLLSLGWIGFHVVLSIFHSRAELLVHVAIFAAFGYFLFRPGANDYFRGAGAIRSIG